MAMASLGRTGAVAASMAALATKEMAETAIKMAREEATAVGKMETMGAKMSTTMTTRSASRWATRVANLASLSLPLLRFPIVTHLQLNPLLLQKLSSLRLLPLL